MDENTKEMYAEVYCILNLLGKDYIEKLPNKLYKMIEDNKQEKFTKQLDLSKLNKDNVKKESIAMIALFHYNYWCKTSKEKENLEKLFKDNELKLEERAREQYNPDNIFKNKNENKNKEETIENENVAMVEYKETTWKKIINKIKSFFKHT